jgi:Flp pilus assembly protein TadB
VFRRRNTSDETPVEEASEPISGKGRPTPKRKDAEAERRQRLKPPRNRREASQRMRERRRSERTKMQEALRSGDERHLPARDRGPVRRFCRDFVDARWNVAEWLLPLLLIILLLSFLGTGSAFAAWLQVVLWTATIIGTVFDTLLLIWRTRRELRRRFPDENRRGAVAYAVLRSSQLRRLRLPKPQVRRGATLPDRY